MPDHPSWNSIELLILIILRLIPALKPNFQENSMWFEKTEKNIEDEPGGLIHW